MPPYELQIKNVEITIGEVQILWRISFEVHKDEIVSIIGSNGAGKSTTLQTIAGLLTPSSGIIEFQREKINGFAPHIIANKGVVLVPDGRKLFLPMTVLENLELGAYSVSAREKKKDNLEIVHQLFPVLKERENQITSTLSGGEQQMVALGRALMSNPKLLMVDEPSQGLAPKLALKIFEKLEECRSIQHISILIVEQNVRKALSISDRAYVMESGKISFSGDSGTLIKDKRIKEAYLGI